MTSKSETLFKAIPWWAWILGIDLFVVSVTALKQYPLAFPGKHWLVRHFNLAVEMNAAVWWSAICLLALALLAYEHSSRDEGRTKFAWLSLAIVFACLSLDELGSLHERVGGWSKLLPYGVVFVSLVACALTVLFRYRQTRRSALFIAAGICVFGTVALQEYIEHAVQWPNWTVGLRIAMEEGSELMGMFLILFGIVPQRSRNMTSSLEAVIPNPARMRTLPEIILIGGIIHTLASMTVPGLIDVGEKGNPLIWYPSAVFFILFAASRGYSEYLAKPKLLPLLSGFFLLCSAGFAYDPPRLIFVIGKLLHEEWLPGFFFFSLTGLLLMVGAAIPGFWTCNKRYLLMLMLLPFLSLPDGRPEIRFLTGGIMAFTVFNIFRRYEPESEGKRPTEETSIPSGISIAATDPMGLGDPRSKTVSPSENSRRN